MDDGCESKAVLFCQGRFILTLTEVLCYMLNKPMR